MFKKKKTHKNNIKPTKNKYLNLSKNLSYGARHKFFYLTLAAVIILIAILARTHHISTLPPGIYPDEAVNGTDAVNSVEKAHLKLFYPNNYGREGLYMNLLALGFMAFGVNIITLKMWSAFFGIFTVAGMMLLGRELFGTYRAGLVAGFLYATSFWAINFSRITFRAIMLPFVLVFSFYFLVKGLRTGKYINYILSGAFFSLGLYTYIAFRIAPVILVAFLIALVLSRKNFLKDYWKAILIFAAAAFIVALPMLGLFFSHPEYFESRSESVSVLSPKVNQGNLLKALGESTALTLGMFNFHGDQNWRHNHPDYAQLEFFAGIFFLVGLGWLVYRFFYALYGRIREKKRNEEFPADTLILAWFFAMLLPGILTYEGLPHALRVIGALPAVFLIVTFAIEKTFICIGKNENKRLRNASYALLIVVIIWSGFMGVKRYFIDWAGVSEIHPAFTQNFKNMALYLNSLPDDANKYVVANAGGQTLEDGFPVSTQVIRLLTHEHNTDVFYLHPDFSPGKIESPAKVVLMYFDGEVIERIKSEFPEAYLQKVDPQPGNGTDFFVVNVN